MKFHSKKLSNKQLLSFYQQLVKPRLIEEKMILLLRQGKISKWFSGIGQEAISVGAALVMDPQEYILPMHRNLGVFTTRGIPLERLFAQFQGKLSGFTKGRDRSFHFGSKEHNLVGMISHLGPQLAVADGIALADILQAHSRATLVFCGDGGASEGDFHEALNVASVWNLPVIFVIENNGYGLSTPSSEQFKFKSFTDKGPGYGMETQQVDGNNLLEVYHTLKQAVNKIRKTPAPILIEALTFRMRGHEEASGTKYVPRELMEYWADRDPIAHYEKFLLQEKVLTEELKNTIREDIKAEIEQALEFAYAEEWPTADTTGEEGDMYAPSNIQNGTTIGSSEEENMRFVDAISLALHKGLEKHPNLILMGQDIADYGGVFKVTEGLYDVFGKERVRNTPLCESAIVGIGLGLSIKGYKSIVEMQFADFVTCGFNQIINNLAKSHYRWEQNSDVVIRMPTGAGVGAGPYHSQSNEAWFVHTPGLKVVYPSNPADALGLLLSAIEDPNPVLYFEHKALYRSLSGPVAQDYHTTPLGQAKVVQSGDDLSIITYGMGVHWALELAASQPEYSIEIVDLRTLLPWDQPAVAQSVNKTGKVIVLHEDCMTGGIGGEISAWIGEHCFDSLDGPVVRVASLDTAVPFSKSLEDNFLPVSRLKNKFIQLMAY
ncbi:MAG: dehydrogenase E1 component subunit alpha/beta [Cyclobacteriaceae bacterium]|nr:dehydrogenase E1 component subunit alpha/beta [Cyclobacteriaceae bacterium]